MLNPEEPNVVITTAVRRRLPRAPLNRRQRKEKWARKKKSNPPRTFLDIINDVHQLEAMLERYLQQQKLGFTKSSELRMRNEK